MKNEFALYRRKSQPVLMRFYVAGERLPKGLAAKPGDMIAKADDGTLSIVPKEDFVQSKYERVVLASECRPPTKKAK